MNETIDYLIIHGWIKESLFVAERDWRDDIHNPVGWANLVHSKVAAGFFDDAFGLTELRSEFELDREILDYGRALIHYKLAQFQDASSLYESLVDLSFPFQAQHGLFMCFTKTQRFSEALSILELLIRNYGQNAYVCRAAIEFAERLRLFSLREVLIDALIRMQSASKRETNPQDILSRATYGALGDESRPSPLQRLNALSRNGNLSNKGADLESQKIVDEQPRFYYSHFIRGRVLLENKSFIQSAASFDRACELNPTDSQSFYFAANAYAHARNWELAELRGEQALGMDPLNDWVVTLMRKIYRRSFRLKLAWSNEGSYLQIKDECQQLVPRFEENVVCVICGN